MIDHKPYKGERPRAIRQVRALRLVLSDRLCQVMIILGFVTVVALIPPWRSYPIIDDWIYQQSIRDLLSLNYHPHEWSQATALPHLVWGALFAAISGNDFSVLTTANLVISLACLLTFYNLLRTLDLPPVAALFGVAVLGFNPIYLYLSYSFMTDITFLLFMLLACLLYITGLRREKDVWLFLGSLSAALACLTRQFGALVLISALLWLWLARRWSLRRVTLIATLPLLSMAGYTVWQMTQPTPLVSELIKAMRGEMLQDLGSYLVNRLQWTAWILCALGLMILPVLRLPKRPLLAAPPLLVLVVFVLRSYTLYGSAFPHVGNTVDSTGFLMHNYSANPVWNQRVWMVLAVLGATTISLHMAFALEKLASWFAGRTWQRNSVEIGYPLILNILGWSMAGVTLVVTPLLFDRYSLMLFPILIVSGLRDLCAHSAELASANREAPTNFRRNLRIAGSGFSLLVMCLFALLAMSDYREHASVRWTAAQELVANGADPLTVRAGFEWESYYGFEPGARRIRETGDLTNITYPQREVFDPVYAVSDLPLDGYVQIGAVPYTSRLDGWATRQVLILKRK